MSQTGIRYPIEIVDKWNRPLASFERSIDRVDKKNVDPFRNTSKSVEKTNIKLEDSKKRLDEIKSSKSGVTDLTARWGAALKAVAGAYVGIQGMRMLYNQGKEAVLASAQVQKYNITLKTMLGSTEAARDRMQEYFDIAAKTPFQLNEVVEAGNQLQAIGRYSRDNLTMIGDLAAASGKGVDQAMNAFQKLAMGEKGGAMRMFRDLLISTEDWVEATGKGVSNTGELLATTDEMLAALPAIMEKKGFMGMMEEQVNSTEGAISNLKDSTFQLQVALGNRLRPTVDRYTRSATRAVDQMKRWVEVPVSREIAKERYELNLLVDQLVEATEKGEDREDLIARLQKEYPDFIKNIDIETASVEELKKQLALANDEYDRKIRHAVVVRRMQHLEEDMIADDEKAMKYRESVRARERKEILEEEIRQFANAHNLPMSQARTVLRDIGETGAWVTSQQKTGGGGSGLGVISQSSAASTTVTRSFDIETQLAAQMLYDELLVLEDAISWFDERRLKDAEASYRRNQMRRAAFQEMLEEDFGDLLGGTDAGEDTGDVDGGKSGTGAGKYDFQRAQDVISGGGRNVRNFYIDIGSLIHENNNYFDSGDDPSDANAFMQKLSRALQLVVNDVNYSAR